MLWLFFGAGGLTAVLFALRYALAEAPAIVAQRPLLVAIAALLALCFAAGGLAAARGRQSLGVLLAAWASVAATGSTSVLLGQGAHAPLLGFLALLPCLACVLVSRRAGVALLVGGVALLAGLGAAELAGALPPRAVESPLGAVLTGSLMLACGFVAGLVGGQVLSHSRHVAGERERRFASLLGIAADGYWEMDAELRFTHVSDASAGGFGLAAERLIGRRAWELPELQLDAAALAALRDLLDARQPFRDLVVQRGGGLAGCISLSGEPIFGADGGLRGYWGVGRDVGAQVQGQRAALATEMRYRELFARSPSPLLLHRRGVVVEVNDAAVALLGYPDAAAVVGVNIGVHFETRVPLEAMRARTTSLDQRPADFRLRRLDGREVEVQVTSLGIDLDDGPAVLSIYTDTTAQRAAERALERSQALTRHLIAATPDTMSVTELVSGRYLMINAAFTRLLGWTPDDVAGRTSAELKIWKDPADRARLLDTLREHGTVSDVPAEFGTKTGGSVSLSVSAASFRLDGAEHLVVTARDVSAITQTRREREATLRHASIGIAFTRDRRFVHANPYFEAMFGWPPGGLEGQPGVVVWPSEAAYAEVGRVAGPLLAVGQPFEVERPMQRRDGSQLWVRIMARVVDPGDPSRGGTTWIAEDVTERRANAAALAAARDAAEAASQAKSAFLANTSHEIRTPLNGLIGMARLLQAEDLDPTRRRDYLRHILDSAESLAAIISDILDLSKIEAGKLSLEALPFDPREVLGTVCRAYETLADERGLGFGFHVDAGVPDTVLGDPVRVRQVLGNFVGNALKFTERGRIDVALDPAAPGRLRLAVTDTGPGIAADTLARLFRPFTQADDSTTRRYGGTGLGLSICHELAALMGGEVGVDSRPGQGSCFWAELPLPATTAVLTSPEDAGLRVRQLRGARVLLVEDNPVNMMIGVAMLEQWGVQVTQAMDGQEALDAVAAADRHGPRFDAVLMDVQMPVMSGHEAARRLREHHDRESLPIVALTAAALVSEREQALAAGMDAFLTKPIDAAHLQRTLVQVLNARESA